MGNGFPGTPDSTAHRPSKAALRLALALVLTANFMCGLDQWVVNVAVDAIGAQLPGANLGGLSWVINAYTIAIAAFLVVGGRLADRYGVTRVFLIGLVVFTAGSALCALAPDVRWLILFRVVQGLGGALLTTASLSLLVGVTDPEGRPHAIRLWAAVGALAAATGPSLGGLLAAVDWRWIFLINVPIGLVASVLTAIRAPRLEGQTDAPHPDVIAALALSAGVAALVGLVVELPTVGWTTTTAGAGTVLVGAAFLFVDRTRRGTHPLIDPGVIQRPGFGLVGSATLVYSAGFGVMLLSNSLWLQDVWRFGPALTGLAMAPGPLMVPVTTALMRRYGHNVRSITFAAWGGVLFALSMMWGILLRTSQPDYLHVFLPQLLMGGAAAGLTIGNLIAAGAERVPQGASGAGNGILNTARQIGSAIGVAAVVTALALHHGAPGGFKLSWAVAAVAGLATTLLALVVRARDTPTDVRSHG